MKTKMMTLLFTITLSLACTQNSWAESKAFNPLDAHHSLYIPQGKGPFPAVLLLHASGGVQKVFHQWAARLKKAGYVVYIIDSFSPRGYKDRKSVGWDKATAAQLADIAPAYQYLSTLPKVDTHRIGLLGFSMGGYSTLRAMQTSGEGTIPALKALHFKAAASFYGVCKWISPHAKFKNTMKILIGDQDDRSTTAACKTLVNSSPNVSIKIYPNAPHGFDNAELPQLEEVTDEKGEIYHVGYNKKSAQDARYDLLEYFKENLKK